MGILIDLDVPAELHPQTKRLVQDFAKALAEKLCAAEKKYGYIIGWKDTNWEIECRRHLHHHITKGDPLDVAAYSAFMWWHGWSTKGTTVELRPGSVAADYGSDRGN